MSVLPFGGRLGEEGFGSGLMEGMRTGALVGASQVDTEIKREGLKRSKEDRARMDESNRLKAAQYLLEKDMPEEAFLHLPQNLRDKALAAIATNPDKNFAWAQTPESRAQMRDAFANGVTAMDMRNPKGITDSLNAVFKDQLNIGNSPDILNKEIAGVVPLPQEGTFALNLKLTKADGTTEIAPLTEGRSSDPKDPVRAFTMEQIANYAKRRAQIATLIDARLMSNGDAESLKRAADRLKGESMAKALRSYDPNLSQEENRRNIGASMYSSGATSADVGTVLPTMVPNDAWQLHKQQLPGGQEQDVWVNPRTQKVGGVLGAATPNVALANLELKKTADSKEELLAKKQQGAAVQAEINSLNKELRDAESALSKAQTTKKVLTTRSTTGALGEEESKSLTQSEIDTQYLEEHAEKIRTRRDELAKWLSANGFDFQGGLVGSTSGAGASRAYNPGGIGGDNREKFKSPEEGLDRLTNLLQTTYAGRTLKDIGEKYCPRSDPRNDTDAWIRNVAKASGINPLSVPDMNDPETLRRLVKGIMVLEVHASKRSLFTDAAIAQSVQKATGGKNLDPENPAATQNDYGTGYVGAPTGPGWLQGGSSSVLPTTPNTVSTRPQYPTGQATPPTPQKYQDGQRAIFPNKQPYRFSAKLGGWVPESQWR
jgi:hypothetical protein